MKRFAQSLAPLSERARGRFFRDNFIALMGRGLDPALYDAAPLKAA
jgi:hypothetical protein